VIIPAYNRARYLEEALASAAAQDLEELVVVVADNASEDDTPSVVARAIEAHGPGRVHYVRRETNIGWRANFNLAFADVTTEFALLLGDDDRLLPGALSRGVAALDREPSAGFAHAAFETIDEAGRRVETPDNWTYGLTSDTFESGSVFIARSMPWPTRVCVHTALIRRSAFQDPMWDPQDGLTGDCILWLRIALDWGVQYVATAAVQRRVHRGALSTGFGHLAGIDYIHEPDGVVWERDAKVRFIDRFASRLEDPQALRRDAYKGSRRDLARACRAYAGSSRRVGAGAIARSLRAQPAVLVESSLWRAIVKVLVGPRVSARLSRQPRPASP
jgi:glycosyltransferase involved in cell wall biosynthesis